MKKAIIVAAALILTLAVVGCQKTQEAPITGGGQGTLPEGHPAGGEQTPMFQPVTSVDVPADIKAAWNSVKLSIEDKGTGKSNEAVVKVNSEYAIPDTKLKVVVGDFLPDFKMNGPTITSVSNEPNNPAVHVTVFESDQEIFKGWLYSKFPAIHPFEHEKYGITLKEGVKS